MYIIYCYYREHAHVCQILSDLSVWEEAPIPGGLPGWILNFTFKRNLKTALLGGYVKNYLLNIIIDNYSSNSLTVFMIVENHGVCLQH